MNIFDKIRSEMRKFDSIFRLWPFSPNTLTLFALLFALIGVFLLRIDLYIGIIVIGLSFLVDGLDGAVARAKGQVTKFGGFLDGVLDRVVEAIILVSLLPVPGIPHPGYLSRFADIPYFYSVLITLVFGSLLTAFVLPYAYYQGVIERDKFDVILPRTLRVVAILIGILIPNIFPIIALLSFISFLQRFLYVYYRR